MPEPPPVCPHCGAPMALSTVWGDREHLRCGLCWLRTPNFPATPPGQALAWIERLRSGPTALGISEIHRAAQRMVNAWDRQNEEAAQIALEDLRRLAFRRERT